MNTNGSACGGESNRMEMGMSSYTEVIRYLRRGLRFKSHTSTSMIVMLRITIKIIFQEWNEI